MDKAEILERVKNYIKGALSIELGTEFSHAYNKGIRSIQSYIEELEKLPKYDNKS